MKHEGLGTDAVALLGRPLEALEVERLERYEDLLRERALPHGFVGAADAPRLRDRHIVDSLRAAAVVAGADRSAADLGSGAGLPGIVVAIVVPSLRVRLVESRSARVAFLELAIERLGLPNAEVFAGRASNVAGPMDLCFARAFADVRSSWAIAKKILRPGGRLVYFGGKGFDAVTDTPKDVAGFEFGPSVASSGPLVIMTRQ